MSSVGDQVWFSTASASLVDSVRILATAVLPNVKAGLFSKDREAAAALAAADTHGATRDLLTEVRAKHDDPDVLTLLGGRFAIVFPGTALDTVLYDSATRFGSDPDTKRKGMEHFQPRALTISTGEEWKERRAFNEHVLATGTPEHPDAARFLGVVAEEVARLVRADASAWRTDDVRTLFEKITLRVVLGDAARDDHTTVALLSTLMEEANSTRGLDESPKLDQLRALLASYVHDAEDGSLVARCPHAPQGPATDPVDQVPHWLFAMKDTLALNVAQALAILAARPELAARVREEAAAVDLRDPAAVQGGMPVTGGVLEEAMRLWPTTWIIARRTLEDVEMAGTELSEGIQVLVLNTFNHRAKAHVPDADDVIPERWSDRSWDVRDTTFNHLSNGPQICAGIDLVHLLGRSVLGHLVADDLELLAPTLPAAGPMPTTIDPFAVHVQTH